jgi:hypothetical protein
MEMDSMNRTVKVEALAKRKLLKTEREIVENSNAVRNDPVTS